MSAKPRQLLSERLTKTTCLRRPTLTAIKNKTERRERAREGKALSAARLSKTLEKELIARLKSRTYGDAPLNVNEDVWRAVLEGEKEKEKELEGLELEEEETDEDDDEDEDEEEEYEREFVSDLEESDAEDLEDWDAVCLPRLFSLSSLNPVPRSSHLHPTPKLPTETTMMPLKTTQMLPRKASAKLRMADRTRAEARRRRKEGEGSRSSTRRSESWRHRRGRSLGEVYMSATGSLSVVLASHAGVARRLSEVMNVSR